MRELAVIIIIAHKEQLSDAEKRSLKQCYAVLGKYRIVLICPQGLNVSQYKDTIPEAEISFIDPKWQADYRMFNRLKIERMLYETYSNYKFMLYYELDAWVFNDDLEKWCAAGYDYIGAPWIKSVENDIVTFLPKGGNGGLSLRNIDSHLRVLKTRKIMASAKNVLLYYKGFHNFVNRAIRFPIIIRRMLGYENNTQYFIRNFVKNEDVFWSVEVNKVDADFKVAPPDVAMKFSFERQPSLLYKMNNEQLPFGCHAWERYEPEFWKKFIK